MLELRSFNNWNYKKKSFMKLSYILIIDFLVRKQGYDVLKFLGDDGLQLMTQLIHSIHETTEWPSDFTALTVIALRRSQNLQNAVTIAKSASSHIQQKLAAITIRRFEMKIAIGENQFVLRRGQGTRNATGMLRIISEETLDIHEELCSCLTEWQKTFDHVN